MVHRNVDEEGETLHIQYSKTEAGCRKIPMISEVYRTFLEEYQINRLPGFARRRLTDIQDLYLQVREGRLQYLQEVNHAIHNITADYNNEETANLVFMQGLRHLSTSKDD